MCVFKKGGISVYGVVSAFLTVLLLLAVINFFSPEVETNVSENHGIEEDSDAEEFPSFVSLAGSLENAYFENNNLVIRNGGGARLELEPGSYEASVDLQGCPGFVVNRSTAGFNYNSLRERVVYEGDWRVERLSSEERKEALVDERVHTLFIREKDTWESYSLPLDDSLTLNTEGVVNIRYRSLCESSVLIKMEELGE